MFSFGSGSGISTLTPLGMFAGYLLADSGNIWVGAVFIVVTLTCFFISMSSLCRFIINYRRSKLVIS